jgi:prepilin-type N-terminal cleavage/methylation domain-containing protein
MKMFASQTLSNDRGFTLLEVMIAIGVLAIGIGAILTAENNSLDVTLRAKRMTTVATLAKNQIIDAELELQGKTFDEVKEDSTGKFDAPYADYSWERKIKEITFPNVVGPGGGGGAAEGGAAGGATASGSNPEVDRIVKIATSYLSKSTREITVTIKWVEKKEDQKFTVSQYWVDLNHEFNFSETP